MPQLEHVGSTLVHGLPQSRGPRASRLQPSLDDRELQEIWLARHVIWRSGTACGSVIFARPLFLNLGVHYGVTLLSCLSVLGIFGTTAMYVFGKKLRMRSKFATD